MSRAMGYSFLFPRRVDSANCNSGTDEEPSGEDVLRPIQIPLTNDRVLKKSRQAVKAFFTEVIYPRWVSIGSDFAAVFCSRCWIRKAQFGESEELAQDAPRNLNQRASVRRSSTFLR